MGSKGNRNITTGHSAFSEPTLLVDLKSLIELSKENDCWDGNSLDIKKLVLCISDKNPEEKIDIEYIDMDPANSGSLNFQNNTWHIRVNRGHNPKRQKFTIAHELGHYMLHRHTATEFNDEIFFRSQLKDNIEYNANLFASLLLMPEAEVRASINRGNINIGLLADEFGVSAPAMKNRVLDLGYKLKNDER